MLAIDIEKAYAFCVEALRDFAHGIGCDDVVIGLSGGIDSSVVAKMCVDAFGVDHVHGYRLPGPYSTVHSVDDATDLAQRLGVSVDTISIKGAYEAFKAELEDKCAPNFGGTAAQNTQARCRMICLMALSNAHGWMLVNTGNRSEAFMGYSTLYGDTAGAFAPIGGLYKTEVFALANWLNERAREAGEVEPIPQHVIDKPPSAELADGQTDEDSLGVAYAVLDQVLSAVFDEGREVADIAAELGISADKADDIVRRAQGMVFKRSYEPPFPEVDRR